MSARMGKGAQDWNHRYTYSGAQLPDFKSGKHMSIKYLKKQKTNKQVSILLPL